MTDPSHEHGHHLQQIAHGALANILHRLGALLANGRGDDNEVVSVVFLGKKHLLAPDPDAGRPHTRNAYELFDHGRQLLAQTLQFRADSLDGLVADLEIIPGGRVVGVNVARPADPYGGIDEQVDEWSQWLAYILDAEGVLDPEAPFVLVYAQSPSGPEDTREWSDGEEVEEEVEVEEEADPELDLQDNIGTAKDLLAAFPGTKRTGQP